MGDFTELLTEVNAKQTLVDYPSNWTRFSITVNSGEEFFSGRVAFRYFVTDGGTGGHNSDYIGVDSFAVTAP